MKVLFLALSVYLWSDIVFAAPVLTYQGRILKADSTPVKTPTSFTIAITNPSGSCVLWSEPFSSSMNGGDGSFSFTIGAGVRSDAGTKEFKDIFSDGVVIPPNANCSGGYTKLSSDVLKLNVSFNDGTGVQSLPAMDITAVPFAIEAQKVAGVASENVLRVSDGIASPLSSANFSELLALLNGTSSQYSKTNQLNGSAIPALGEGQVLGWSGGAWAAINQSGGGLSSVTANAPLAVDSSVASSPKISLPKADASTNGYLDKTDWATFNQKQSRALENGKIWVGDSGNIANPVVPGGDLSMAGDGAFSVLKIRGNDVASGAIPALDIGKVYRWNGSQFVASFLNFGDLKTSTGATQLATTCAANKKIQWSVITDTFTCEAIGALDASAITTGTIDMNRLPSNVNRWQDGTAGAVYYDGGNVGIGTAASPTAKLEVNGSIKPGSATIGAACSPEGAMAYDMAAHVPVYCNQSGLWASSGGAPSIPSGAVMHFNLASCPTGWSELVAARGRYVVGLPSGGTLAQAVGTALSNGENRPVGQHSHSINDPGHGHTLNIDPYPSRTTVQSGSGASVPSAGYYTYTTSSTTTGITINNFGTVAGTNAPYIQLLVCVKD